jgi:hypothetical protein
MFGSAILKCSGHQRPFWLTVALSVMLLVSVSITIAHAANPIRLAADLGRDLGAMRVQLEVIGPSDRGSPRQTITFNADLGDGGPAFRRHSMATMAATANRRLERLIESYREGAERGDAAPGDVRPARADRPPGAHHRARRDHGAPRGDRGDARSLGARAEHAARGAQVAADSGAASGPSQLVHRRIRPIHLIAGTQAGDQRPFRLTASG